MTVAAARTTRLHCHAAHPAPGRTGERCGAFLGDAASLVEFVAVAPRAPRVEAVGVDWRRCTRKSCEQWNCFRIVERR